MEKVADDGDLELYVFESQCICGIPAKPEDEPLIAAAQAALRERPGYDRDVLVFSSRRQQAVVLGSKGELLGLLPHGRRLELTTTEQLLETKQEHLPICSAEFIAYLYGLAESALDSEEWFQSFSLLNPRWHFLFFQYGVLVDLVVDWMEIEADPTVETGEAIQ